MTRSLKNVLTVLILLLCLIMLLLTVLSALGRTAGAAPTEDAMRGDMPSLSPGGAPPTEDDVEIGEMPGVGDASEPAAAPEPGMTPPTGGDRPQPVGGDGGAPSGVALLPYLGFAAVWLFLLAFTLAWALFSRMNAYSPFAKRSEDTQDVTRQI